MKSFISVISKQSYSTLKPSRSFYFNRYFSKLVKLVLVSALLFGTVAVVAAAENTLSDSPEEAKIGFEPKADFALIAKIIQPILARQQDKLSKFDVPTITPPLKSALGRSPENLTEPKEILNLISSKVDDNLGMEEIIGTSDLAPELPELIAKVYLPEASDYDLTPNFIWPARGLLSSGFGWRWGRLHQGIDIAAPVGTPIWAADGGVVDYAGWNNGGFGNMIDILHPNGTITRYAHLHRIHVRKGQSVNQSQVIGTMGNTGFSTGPHLHFEIRPNGRSAIDPMLMLARSRP